MAEKTKADKPKKKSEAKRLQMRTDRAEARKAEVELKRAKISLRLDELRAQEVHEQYAWKLNSDRSHGVFNLETSVGSSAIDLAGDLRQFGRTYPDAPITLNIFSPGGSIVHGITLYDTLRTLSAQGHEIVTCARGYAASMAAILFLAGDVRLVGAETDIMLHSLSAGTGGSLHDLEDDLRYFKKLQSKIDNIIVSRTDISPQRLAKETKKQDWWISSDEAVKLGVAHDIA